MGIGVLLSLLAVVASCGLGRDRGTDHTERLERDQSFEIDDTDRTTRRR